MLDEATVTMACEAHDPSAAAEAIRSIIRKNAELVAHIGVREIEIISISPSDLAGNGDEGQRGQQQRRRPATRFPSFAHGSLTLPGLAWFPRLQHERHRKGARWD